MAANWTAFSSGAVLTAAQLNGVVDNFADIAIFNEQQTSGTDGGASTSGSFIKRTLNTTVVNNITGCSIASSVITLPAGTYSVLAFAPFVSGSSIRIKLRNTTDSTDTLFSQNLYGAVANAGSSSLMSGVFTIAASKNFEVQYRVSNGIASFGLGAASNFGTEIYTSIQITRIA